MEDNWGALRTLSIYRWSVAVLLIALWGSDLGQRALPNINSTLLPLTVGLYLIASPLLSLGILFRQPGFSTQVYLHAGVDITLTTLLVMASGGMGSGLGVLMLTPVAGIGTLVPRRMAILLAAIASLSLLAEEISRDIYALTPQADYTLAGLIGTLVFIVSFAANALAQRASASARLAEQRGLDLANLSHVNERIIHHMAIGVIVLDDDDRIRLINQAALGLLGRNITVLQELLPEASPELAQRLSAWRSHTPPAPNEESLQIGNRKALPHFNRLGGDRETTLIFLEDADRFGEQAQQIKLAALGRLTASVAHEIRNPLGAISHASQLIQEWRNSPDEEARLLDIIDRHCQRINQIVESILNLSRRQETLPQTIHLLDWLSLTIEDYRHTEIGAESTIVIDKIPRDLAVRFDPNHLRQIIHNLWDNAIRHATRGKTPIITLSTGVDEATKNIYLDVKDNGPGIQSSIAEHIFEPFYTSLHSGTGLGLYLARELCECNQAGLRQIHCEEGACFRITFPRNIEWAA